MGPGRMIALAVVVCVADAATDNLRGIYFQAVQQQQYEVVLLRRR